MANASFAMTNALFLEDRIAGWLVGLAVGDALGVPVEFSRTRPKQVYTGFVPTEDWFILFRWSEKKVEAASVSDDTEMTLALLFSLLEKNGYDRDHVLLSYLSWANGKPPPPMGKNTRLLMHGVKTVNGFDKRKVRLVDDGTVNMATAQSNGTLMRVSPLVLLADPTVRKEAVETDCSLTNDNPVNSQCSIIYLSVLRLLLFGEKQVPRFSPLDPAVREVIRDVREKKERDISSRAVKGWVCTALYAALYAVTNYATFEDAMDWIIEEHPGSDTDTNACIAGALMGASLGLSGMLKEKKTKINVERVLGALSNSDDPKKVELSTPHTLAKRIVASDK